MSDGSTPYRVLARKYRPQNFDTLIGQDAMVKTLANAIAAGRLAHAFILTGVRGVGKTTTARIIARALNCIGEDGKGGPTTQPCGVCEPCRAIAESRHVDVMEMDAASRTGIDDIREIIEGVQYAPVSARFKIYIIDEVHMLSKSAFNALLKTLEEPPEHVKFLFATTEIRKLPVTVLSRCQRFDLRRVDAEKLIAHLASICKQEEVKADDAALAMIARAAEGSVRDSLSLLDQAIAHGAGEVSEALVRDMLGLADHARILDLLRAVMSGDVAEALSLLRGQYDLGADPAVIISDLLESVHWLTRLKLSPDASETFAPEAERTLGLEMAESLSMPHLSRAWQLLLKGLGEVRTAPSPISAAEMVLIRLTYMADLPSPADVIKSLQSNPASGGAGETSVRPSGGRQQATAEAVSSPPAQGVSGARADLPDRPVAQSGNAGAQILALKPDAGESTDGADYQPVPLDFEAMVQLFHEMREPVLATMLKDRVRPVGYRPGRLSINVDEQAPADLARRVQACLNQWTGIDWQVVITGEKGNRSLREKELAHRARLREEALADPLVRAVIAAFPNADLVEVKDVSKQITDMEREDVIPPGADDVMDFEGDT